MSKESFSQFIRNRTRGVLFGRTRLGDFLNAMYGFRILLKYSFSQNNLRSKSNYRAFLTKQYHILEKGLSLPNPRQNFGKEKIEILLNITKEYIEKYESDKLSQLIKNCLLEYKNSNSNLSNVYPSLATSIDEFTLNHEFENIGGTKIINKAKIQNAIGINFLEFVQTRTSVRNFSPMQINYDDIKAAVDIARHAPSVCNRQAWNLHYYEDEITMKKLLFLQAGNSGFTNSIKGLFVVTSDTKQFTRLEGNQVFTDGGLFSMNLILALHSRGLGSCCLNTCVPYTTEKRIKKIANITESERLIMMIGVGYLKEEFKTAYSEKKPISEILHRH
ncbi:nitroreductase family protein [Psychroflexus planctonicus]|uniref:Nitroreductase domain-containing protein n=1 Tax=Psychroflexus planctonicus TaxID=1526575 RepID=A0ABQ1SL04_9FLAO|nr:nitroreductase family protein [Psychroflexus planctonicus]GGE41905.1 hypothetical protein GCM10010832_22450 [Psychroflexus planctonicus]